MSAPVERQGCTSAVRGIVLAGGQGRRLGGCRKAALRFGGETLLEHIVRGLAPHLAGPPIIVTPEKGIVPENCVHTCENPPYGGPLAGIFAGLQALPLPPALTPSAHTPAPFSSPRSFHSSRIDAVLICSVDAPGIIRSAPLLLEAFYEQETSAYDGVIVHGGEPEPFSQYLQGIYRFERLQTLLKQTSDGHNRSVRSFFAHLKLKRLSLPREYWQDIDTPEDVVWWQEKIKYL